MQHCLPCLLPSIPACHLPHSLCTPPCLPFGLCSEADRLFQAEEEDKHNSLMDVTALDDPNCPLSACSKILKAAMADVNRGVIIMNANCLMTAANKVRRGSRGGQQHGRAAAGAGGSMARQQRGQGGLVTEV